MIFVIVLLVWFYHVPQLNDETYDNSIQMERERYMFQLGANEDSPFLLKIEEVLTEGGYLK